MTFHAAVPAVLPGRASGFLDDYLETLGLVERLHRLLLDVIKDEFERLGVPDINAVQALLLFNIGANEVTAGELRTRGYYLGSNASYNIKHLVSAGYVEQERALRDKRTVYVRLTDKGRQLCAQLNQLEATHAETLAPTPAGQKEIDSANELLKRLERIWSDHLRYAGP